MADQRQVAGVLPSCEHTEEWPGHAHTYVHAHDQPAATSSNPGSYDSTVPRCTEGRDERGGEGRRRGGQGRVTETGGGRGRKRGRRERESGSERRGRPGELSTKCLPVCVCTQASKQESDEPLEEVDALARRRAAAASTHAPVDDSELLALSAWLL